MQTKQEAIAFAQHRADDSGARWEVWEHVGDYGNPSGDIPAQHTFRVVPALTSLGKQWAMIGVAVPELGRPYTVVIFYLDNHTTAVLHRKASDPQHIHIEGLGHRSDESAYVIVAVFDGHLTDVNVL